MIRQNGSVEHLETWYYTLIQHVDLPIDIDRAPALLFSISMRVTSQLEPNFTEKIKSIHLG